MIPNDLVTFRRRFDCLSAHLPADIAEPLALLFAEMMLSLCASAEREEQIVLALAGRIVILPGDLRRVLPLEDRLARGLSVLPPDGIGALLRKGAL